MFKVSHQFMFRFSLFGQSDQKQKKSAVQAFLNFRGFNFRDFRFTAVYNFILFSSPLVLLSNLDLRVFRHIFFTCPHINSTVI